MADKKTIHAKLKIKFRGDTEENLQSVNPVLALKEPCFVLDENDKTIGFKVGDGIHNWNDLEYHSLEGGGSGGSIEVDQTYNPGSENAQSGKAVAEAVTNKEQYIFEVLRENYVSKEQLDTAIGQALEGDY